MLTWRRQNDTIPDMLSGNVFGKLRQLQYVKTRDCCVETEIEKTETFFVETERKN